MTTAVHRSPKLLDELRKKLRVMHYGLEDRAGLRDVNKRCPERKKNILEAEQLSSTDLLASAWLYLRLEKVTKQINWFIWPNLLSCLFYH